MRRDSRNANILPIHQLPDGPPITFVTAIYQRTPDDALGGRGRPLAFYFDSLRRLTHYGASWVVYTDPADAGLVQQFARAVGVPMHVVPRALELVPRFKTIQAVREQWDVRSKPYRDRCHVLCFAKAGWLAAEAAAPRFGSEHVYWIDAGLAHEGLFPRRLRARPQTIFNPQALSGLCGSGRLLFLAHPLGATQHGVSVELMTTIAGLDSPPRAHVVGGLFGGRRDRVLHMAARFDTLHAAMLGAGLLGTEENVLTLLAAHDGECRIHEFDTWYHEDTDFTQPGPGQHSFYRILEDWAASRAAQQPAAHVALVSDSHST